ncbi:MAG: PSD1 and planctomycete cytochrome C domain-containing protein [Limisphaerales bacterium]
MTCLLPLATPAAELPTNHAERMRQGTALFQETVRPVLMEQCLKCHGGEKERSGLNLATHELLLKGGDSGPVIDPEEPQGSLLMRLLRHREDPNMPPKGPRLSTTTLAAIERWIGLGAPYDKPLIEGSGAKTAMVVTDSDREFWSFKPLRKVDGNIDQFVRAKLKKRGLRPSAPALSRTFVRRAYLDLIGLPPTPKQLSAGMRESKEDLIDRLLDSQHYGERWARHWLDAARFAESHGFEQDYDRKYAFHYRDFVIKALNQDMPFDQFVRWQLAGDEFAPDNPLAMMATGFLGAGVFPTQLTEKEFESARYDELDDMAATMGTAMLGLTIGCARCHDHKFDPIPVKDYYQLVASFATTIRSEIELDLNPGSFEKKMAAWQKSHRQVEQPLEAYISQPEFRAAFKKWLDDGAPGDRELGSWSVLKITEAKSSGRGSLTVQPDGSVLAGGKAAAKETYTLKAKSQVPGVRSLRIEALTHKSFRRKGPGRAGNGNFVLSNIKVFASPVDPAAGKRQPVKLLSTKATHQQNQANLSAAASLDSNTEKTGWAVDFGGIGKDQALVVAFAKPISFAGGTKFEFELRFGNGGQHIIGRPRLSVSAEAEPPVVVGGGQSDARSAAFAAVKSGQLNEVHRRELLPLFGRQDPKWVGLNQARLDSAAAKPQRILETVQVSSEGFKPTKHHADGRGFPHFYPQTHFLERGDPNQKKGVATQGFLQVLMRNGKATGQWQEAPPKDWRTSYRRRGLANWITDEKNGAGHLLARVIVNRLWHHHFGRGIVSTPNDFGLQGAEPTHPELLEYLANRLIAFDWKLKPLHREIMLSATYAQKSAPSREFSAIDPANQFLWRFAPRRLEAEVIRDSMLAVSGQLDTKMFGPGTLSAHKRRSIYFMIKRSRLVPEMQIFDQPEPLVSQGSRPRTTIAPQALLFMNSPQVIEYARALAGQSLEYSYDGAIRTIYRQVLNRDPSADEFREARDFMVTQEQTYETTAAKLLARADFCQVMFGLNEFIYLQ